MYRGPGVYKLTHGWRYMSVPCQQAALFWNYWPSRWQWTELQEAITVLRHIAMVASQNIDHHKVFVLHSTVLSLKDTLYTFHFNIPLYSTRWVSVVREGPSDSLRPSAYFYSNVQWHPVLIWTRLLNGHMKGWEVSGLVNPQIDPTKFCNHPRMSHKSLVLFYQTCQTFLL